MVYRQEGQRSKMFGAGVPVLIVVLALVALSVNGSAAPAVPAWRLDTPWSTETATVEFADDTVIAEIADTPELRERGLGYRDDLADGKGMLFVYPSPSVRSFWMKGMRICLDIVWIEDGLIQGADRNACPQPGISDADLTRYVSPVPVTFVLELPAGWLDENGYGPGDPIEIRLPESAT